MHSRIMRRLGFDLTYGIVIYLLCTNRSAAAHRYSMGILCFTSVSVLSLEHITHRPVVTIPFASAFPLHNRALTTCHLVLYSGILRALEPLVGPSTFCLFRATTPWPKRIVLYRDSYSSYCMSGRPLTSLRLTRGISSMDSPIQAHMLPGPVFLPYICYWHDRTQFLGDRKSSWMEHKSPALNLVLVLQF